MENKRSCLTCKKDSIFKKCERLKNNKEYQELLEEVALKDNISKSDAEYSDEPWEFKGDFICEDYKSKYIEYPIEVSKINLDNRTDGWRDGDKGKFVKIRPCNEKYGNRTYLGIYLGELPKGNRVSHNSTTKELKVSFDLNPAIFVFELNEIIYGYQSWWGIIKKESDLESITDLDVDNIWYVKALQSLNK